MSEFDYDVVQELLGECGATRFEVECTPELIQEYGERFFRFDNKRIYFRLRGHMLEVSILKETAYSAYDDLWLDKYIEFNLANPNVGSAIKQFLRLHLFGIYE